MKIDPSPGMEAHYKAEMGWDQTAYDMMKWYSLEATPETFRRERRYWARPDAYHCKWDYLADIRVQLSAFANFKPILHAFDIERITAERYVDFLSASDRIIGDLLSRRVNEQADQPLSYLEKALGGSAIYLTSVPTEKEFRIFFRWSFYGIGFFYFVRHYNYEF